MIIDNSFVPCFPVYNVKQDGSCSCGKVDCSAIGKHPKLTNWHKQFSYPKQHDFINNNYGIPTGSPSKIIIVDVDPRNGGMETFAALDRQIGGFDDTIKVDTPSGGFHLYYQIPNDIDFVIRKQILGNGIDLLGEGAFAVMVNSNHVQGIYKWSEGLSPQETELETIPLGLLSILEENANKKAHDDASVAKGGHSIDSIKLAEIAACLNKLAVTGYQQWLEVAMALHSIGNQGRAPFDLWIKWSQTKDPKNGWRDSDVRKWNTFKAGGAINYKKIFELAKLQGLNPGHFQTTIVDPEFDKALDEMNERLTSPLAPVIDLQPRIEKPDSYIDLYDMDTTAGSFVKALIEEWEEVLPDHVCLALATQVIPSIVFQGLVCTPEMDGINTYTLFVGKQGTGKSIAIDKISRHVLKEIDHKQQMSFPVSGTAFGKELNSVNGVGTLFKDEILDTLRKITNRDDGRQEYMLSLWSLGQGMTFNAQRSAKEGEYEFKAVNSPAFSMIGGGVERDWIEISNDYNFMSKGFGSRLEVITFGKLRDKSEVEELTNYSAMNSQGIKDCIGRMKSVYKYLQDKGHDRNNRFRMKIDNPSKLLIRQFHNKCVAIENEKDFDNGFSLIRLPQQAMKTATRVALMESNLSADRTTLGPMLITRAIMKWSIDYVSNRHKIFEKVSDTINGQDDMFRKKVKKAMHSDRWKNVGMSKSQIIRNIRSPLTPREKWEIMGLSIEDREYHLFGKKFVTPKLWAKLTKKPKK